MGTADSLLSRALSYYGYHEGPNNDTYFGSKYGIPHAAWCDMFVSVCGEESGNRDSVGWFSYCPNHVNWFRSRAEWIPRGQAPRRGDIVFYNWSANSLYNADHVGIVEQATADPSKPVIAIEGNSSDGNTSEGVAVARHQRSVQSTLR